MNASTDNLYPEVHARVFVNKVVPGSGLSEALSHGRPKAADSTLKCDTVAVLEWARCRSLGSSTCKWSRHELSASDPSPTLADRSSA